MANPIASPMADRKLVKKIYKLLVEAKSDKNNIRSGLGEVMKAFRKKETGIVVLAGDVWPIDLYSHVPALCEELEIPYIYAPSKKDLGLAVGFTRPIVAIMIKRGDEYADSYDKVAEKLKALDLQVY